MNEFIIITASILRFVPAVALLAYLVHLMRTPDRVYAPAGHLSGVETDLFATRSFDPAASREPGAAGRIARARQRRLERREREKQLADAQASRR